MKTHVDLLFPHSEINKGVDTNLGVDPKTLKYLIYLFPNENYFRYKKQNKNKKQIKPILVQLLYPYIFVFKSPNLAHLASSELIQSDAY